MAKGHSPRVGVALPVWRAFGAPLSLSKTFVSLRTDIACRRTISIYLVRIRPKSVKPIQRGRNLCQAKKLLHAYR